MLGLLRKHILIYIPYITKIFIIVGFLVPRAVNEFRLYEIIFVLLLLYLVFKRFKTSANVFFLAGLFLLLLSVFFFVLNKDRITIYFADLALIYFMSGAVAVFFGELVFKNSGSSNLDKRVLFVANAIVGLNPGVSGGESRFIELGKQWASKGYEIHLLSSKSGETLCNRIGMRVTLHNLSNSNKESRLEFVVRLLKVLFYLPRLVEDFDSGVVYATSEQIYDVIPGCLLKLIYPQKIAFASAVHWLPPLKFWHRKNSKWYNSLLFMLSERSGLYIAALFADALFPVSESTFSDMKKEGVPGRNITVVKCGVNLGEIGDIVKKVASKKYSAVFMKRIQAVKGIFDLIDIWEIVKDRINNPSLVVIGSGIDEDEAKKRVTTKKMDGVINFAGVIYDTEDKFRHIGESRLFLLPSSEENWAIVIGEAMAAGVPVLCYDLKELREVWEDSVIFIPLGDKIAFADAIVNLLSDEVFYDAIVQKGKEFIRRYDWQSIAEEEIGLIEKGFIN